VARLPRNFPDVNERGAESTPPTSLYRFRTGNDEAMKREVFAESDVHPLWRLRGSARGRMASPICNQTTLRDLRPLPLVQHTRFVALHVIQPFGTGGNA
jgi:hypothetical protein